MRLVERLFGPASEAVTDSIIAELRRAVGTVVDGVGQSCPLPPALSREAPSPLATSLIEMGDALRVAGARLPTHDRPFRVVLLGRTQAGKSTLFNHLSGTEQATIGQGAQRTTREIDVAPMAGRPDIEIVDTPGVGAKDGAEDRQLALDAARDADLIVWVATNLSLQSETGVALEQVAAWGAPFLVAVNCQADLTEPEARHQFLLYPNDTFRALDGHLDRYREFWEPYGQAPHGVFPIHADAARLAGAASPPDLALLRVSGVEKLGDAIRADADRLCHQRRVVATADSGRRQVVAVNFAANGAGADLQAQLETNQSALEDFKQRAERAIHHFDVRFRAELSALLRNTGDWADRHYRKSDKELQAAWDTEAERLQAAAESAIHDAGTRLERRLTQVHNDVLTGWSRPRVAIKLDRGKAPITSVGPLWLEAIGRLGLSALSMYAGGQAGTAVGAALGAATGPLAPIFAPLGATIGGIVGTAIANRLRFRRGQWQRRRKTLHQWVADTLAGIEQDVLQQWEALLGTVGDALASSQAEGQLRVDGLAQVKQHVERIVDSANDAVGRIDALVVRALLCLEGRDRVAAGIDDRVCRHPGFASVVATSDAAVLDELLMWRPQRLPEELRVYPNWAEATSIERAAHALDVGRRGILLTPKGSGALTAWLPGPASPGRTAAEAVLLSTAIGADVEVQAATQQERTRDHDQPADQDAA